MKIMAFFDAFDKHLKAFLATKFFVYAQNAFFKFFINIYFWRITEDIAFLVLYNIVFTVSHLVSYVNFAKVCKEKSRFLPMQIGIFLQVVFFVAIMLAGEQVVDYIVPIAILGGIGHGAYWSSDNLLKFDLSHPKNRLRLSAAIKIVRNVTYAFFPLLASLLIVHDGDVFESYAKIFGITAVLAFFSSLATFRVSKEKNFSAGTFDFCRTSKKLWQDPNIRLACFSTFMVKIADVLPILLGLLLFFSSGNELSIGSYQFITVIVTVIAYYFVGDRFGRKDYKKLLWLGGLTNVLLIGILFISQSYVAIIVYGILSSLFSVANTPRLALTLDAFSMHCKTKQQCIQQRVEYITFEELFGETGKIVGFLILLLLSYSLNVTLIAVVAMLFALSRFIANVLITRLKDRQYVRIDGLN